MMQWSHVAAQLTQRTAQSLLMEMSWSMAVSSTIHVMKASSYEGMAPECVKRMAAGVVYNHLAKVCIFSQGIVYNGMHSLALPLSY